MKGFTKILLSLVLVVSSSVFTYAQADDEQNAVLVTGASSGIGLKITELPGQCRALRLCRRSQAGRHCASQRDG